jgi:uncharacterized protein YdaU (DUF1376 family)
MWQRSYIDNVKIVGNPINMGSTPLRKGFLLVSRCPVNFTLQNRSDKPMKEAPVANNIWFPFYMGDYLAKTSHLSQAEHGAYLCLLLYYYSNKRPISHNRRYSICRAFAEQEQAACDSVLAEYFTLEGDVWINDRVEEELLKSQDISEKRAKAAQSRYKQVQSNCNANAEQMHPQSQSQSQLQITDTDTNPLTPKGGTSERFDEFWLSYPDRRKSNKPQCLDFWKRNKLDNYADSVITGLEAWKLSQDWKKNDGQFIKAPLPWLRGRFWETPPQVKKLYDFGTNEVAF